MAVEQLPTTHSSETHPAHPQIERPPDLPPAPTSRAKILVGTALLILLVAGAITFLSRKGETDALAKETDSMAIPTVAVVQPVAEAGNDELVLPGNLQAFEESPIFARTNGYLLRWYKDIGSKVEKGELLASIDTPEVDQELSQARAGREQIKAALGLAKISADRWANLRKSDSVSQQEADQQESGYTQAQANLAAADANVRRLEQMESFKNVYAPFSGVLTRRNVDPGALINSGAQANGRELFDIARVDPLRVYVSVPQAYAPSMKVGVKAVVTLQEFPGQKFLGTVVRTADAIDMSTRTLNTEVDVPNKGGKLLPGSFGQVHFAVGNSVPRITIPVNAMLFRAEGAQAAVVGQDGKVQLHAIVIGRDFGNTIEILGGVEPSDRIIINPSDSLESGQQVRIAQPAQSQPPGSQPLVRVAGIKSLLTRQTAGALHARGQECPRHTGVSVAVLVVAVLLSGCAVGPNYKRPTAQVPDTWKGEGPWQVATPKDAIPKGNWWELYHDAELNRLEQELLQANQSLAAAQDRLLQARSLARIASSAYFPAVNADPSGERQRLAGNRPFREARFRSRLSRRTFSPFRFRPAMKSTCLAACGAIWRRPMRRCREARRIWGMSDWC